MAPLPAYLQNRKSKPIAEMLAANLGTGSPPYVSIRGNRFTLTDAVGAEEPMTEVDDKTGLPYIDVCIADANEHESKVYYSKPFDPSSADGTPPDCWSDNGVAPSRSASSPQHATCAGCPKAVWGSATSKVSGKGIPACAKNQKLAVILPGRDMAFLLRVPPNSLSNLRDYDHKFRSQKFDISDVMTRISFEKDALGTLTFHAIAMIEEHTFKHREALIAAHTTDQLVGRGDQALVGAPTPQAAGVSLEETFAPPPAQLAVPAQPAAPAKRRNTAQTAPAAETPFHQGKNTGFGVATPNPVTQEMSEMIDSVFE